MGQYYTVDLQYKAYLETLGIPAELIFKRCNLPLMPADKKGYNVSRVQYMSFMDEIGKYADEKTIIEHGNIQSIQMFVPPLFAAMCASDGRSCYRRISKYKRLIGPFELRVEETNRTLKLEFYFLDGNDELPRYTVMTEQVLMIHIIRQGTGLHIVPKEVASPFEYGSDLREFFGVEPKKAKTNYVVFDMDDMRHPFLTSNNTMWSYLEPEFIKRMKELEVNDSFSAQVRSVLFEKVPAGEDTIEDVAKEMAVSVRTLQRRLSAEKTTFIKQLNHTRELLARNYLKDKSLTNDDIAFLIGYSDANAFQRAFRTWTGKTVGEYKRSFVS